MIILNLAKCRRKQLKKRVEPPISGDARERILEAARQMLNDVGPEGIRLQEVAKKAGVSHPLILHHFKNRAGLVSAVVARAVTALEADILAAISSGAVNSPDNPYVVIENAFRALHDQGHGRLLAWLSLSGEGDGQSAWKLTDIARAVHALRKQKLEERGLECPPYEDTAFVVTLASYALFADSICGDSVRSAMPHGKKDPKGERFRRWLTDIITAHIDLDDVPGATSADRKSPKK